MNDNDDIDRAFRAALAAGAPADGPAVAQRRRRAVLAAVDAALVEEPARPAASNDPRWRPMSSGWRGAVVASVLVCSTRLVVRLADEPSLPKADAPPLHPQCRRHSQRTSPTGRRPRSGLQAHMDRAWPPGSRWLRQPRRRACWRP